MSQVTTYTISDGDGLTVLAALNAVFGAVQSLNSGGVAPGSPVSGMPWLDTSGATPIRRRRNAANSGWDLDDLAAVGLGLTVATAVASLDALTIGATYLASSGATGAPITGTAFVVYHSPGATTSEASQEALALGSDRVWIRRKVAGTWAAWVELAAGATTVGLAVLQAATVAAQRTALGLGSAAVLNTVAALTGSANVPTDAAAKTYIDAAVAAAAPIGLVRASASIAANSAITASNGVASVSKGTTGLYFVTLSAAAPNALYRVIAFPDAGSGTAWVTAQTTTTFTVTTRGGGGSLADQSFVFMLVY